CRHALALPLANAWPLNNIAIVAANMAAAGGKYRAATHLLGCAAAYWVAINYQIDDEGPDWKRLHDRAMTTCRAALGEQAFQAAWAEEQQMTLEQAIAEALSC